ncbi:MAG TPA: hypothetical protein IAB90_04815 [Candidatus Coproplasma stercoripullorum]|uniref:Uncharacterized protein n=1 Tax=Candidatus Coproplasma stercoripullorum TaxID=2840751 RepID=A0A9D1AG42_9FIRM|nr:hypothetical protein [Candidatus Coproplasma stercoripullorum]
MFAWFARYRQGDPSSPPCVTTRTFLINIRNSALKQANTGCRFFLGGSYSILIYNS